MAGQPRQREEQAQRPKARTSLTFRGTEEEVSVAAV